MNKENNVVFAQPKRKMVRARTCSDNSCHQILKKLLLSETCIPAVNVERRPALCDLKLNVSSACNQQQWILSETNSSEENFENTDKVPRGKIQSKIEHSTLHDISTQTNTSLKKNAKEEIYCTTSTYLEHDGASSVQTNCAVGKCSYTSEGTPIYTSSLEAGPLKSTITSKIPSNKQIEEDDTHENEEVFVDPGQVFEKMSPIPKNVHTSENTILMPAARKKIVRKTSLTLKRSRMKILGSQCVYEEEYLEDNINCLLNNDLKYVVTVSMLKSSSTDVTARAAVVNWLLKIQICFHLSSEIYLKAVRLFDCVLGNTKVAINMYQLIGITSLWIVTKYDDNQIYLSVKKMISLTGGAYNAEQLIDMEFKLLKYIKYNFGITEPITFAEYYTIRAKIKDKDVLRATYFILELFALSPYFSTLPSSLLAASAVYLSLECLGEDTNMWEGLQPYRAYYHVQHTVQIRSRMQKLLQRISVENFPYTECYKKHNTEETNFIALALCKS